MKTQIIIVGTGSTGLMLANQFVRYGIDFIIIDENSGISQTPQSVTVHARTLEIYDELALADAAIEAGQVSHKIALLVDGQRTNTMDLEEMGEGKSPYPFMLNIKQQENEKLLHDRLTEQGQTVRWNTELVDVAETESALKVMLQRKDGTKETMECQYLVSCEGACRLVSRRLGIRFEPDLPHHQYVTASVKVDWDQEGGATYLGLSQDTIITFLPTPGEQRYQVTGITNERSDDATIADLEDQTVQEAGIDAHFSEARWVSAYPTLRRQATTLREGRMLFAGDAYRAHDPIDGLGMNTGVQDAYQLAWKLAYVVQGQASADLLDTYDAERQQNAEHRLGKTDQLLAAETNGETFDWIQAALFPRIGKHRLGQSFLRYKLYGELLQAGVSHQEYHPGQSDLDDEAGKAGQRLPYFSVNDEKGQQTSIYTFLNRPGFHWIVFSDQIASEVLPDELSGWEETVEAIRIGYNGNQKVLEEQFGTSGELALLLRPDHIIALATDDIYFERTISYLEEHFLLPTSTPPSVTIL